MFIARGAKTRPRRRNAQNAMRFRFGPKVGCAGWLFVGVVRIDVLLLCDAMSLLRLRGLIWTARGFAWEFRCGETPT